LIKIKLVPLKGKDNEEKKFVFPVSFSPITIVCILSASIKLLGGEYVNDANRIEVIEFSSDPTGDSNLS
jgi:hypothetical protein